MIRVLPYLVFLLAWFCLLSLRVAAQTDNQQRIQEIRNAYEGLDFPVAEARILSALGDFEQFTPAQLSDIHTIYAMIHFARNDITLAEAQLEQALQLTPSMTLDTLETPPQLIEIFEALKTRQRSESSTEDSIDNARYVLVYDPRPGAVMRSMVLPGWGQVYKGQHRKGWLLAGLWGLTAGGTVVAHVLRRNAEKSYLNATLPNDIQDRFKTFDTWHKVRNNLFLSAAGVWVFSYLDALLSDAEGSMKAPHQASRQAVSIQPTLLRPGFSLTWKFD